MPEENHKTTWFDIKLATLQKMFSSNGTTIQMDSSNKEYLESMPQAANEGLQLLATAGKFILKAEQIVVHPVRNILADGFQRVFVDSGDKVYVGHGRSYYFTVMGEDITCTITVGEGEPIHITTDDEYIQSAGKLSTFKGVIDNPDDEPVALSFSSQYPYELRNVCMYMQSYKTDTAVPDYEEYIRYSLPDIFDSFYQLSENDLYYEGENGGQYVAADEYYQEADKTLVIPRSEPGIYTIYYKAYPQMITNETEDEYVLELDPEVAAILPLYMASQLYKDDDNSIATVYRNEFEVAFDRLSQKAKIQRKEEFESVYGWC
jgi:hypothetical protein